MLWRDYQLISDTCRIFCLSTVGAETRKLAVCRCKNETRWKLELARQNDGGPNIQHELGRHQDISGYGSAFDGACRRRLARHEPLHCRTPYRRPREGIGSAVV